MSICLTNAAGFGLLRKIPELLNTKTIIKETFLPFSVQTCLEFGLQNKRSTMEHWLFNEFIAELAGTAILVVRFLVY